MKLAVVRDALSCRVFGPAGEPPTAVGRLPADVSELVLGLAEPSDLRPGQVAVCPRPRLGPAFAIGAWHLHAPGGLLDRIARAMSPRGAHSAVGGGRLLKLTVFVPQSHLDAVRDAVCQSGAGFIGGYRDCTFTSLGTGTFLPLQGAAPFLGAVGQRAYEDEARLETVLPAHRADRVLAALRRAHPYEEVAYDLFELTNVDPTYGPMRLIQFAPTPLADVARQVQQAVEAKAIAWLGCRSGQIVQNLLLVGDGAAVVRHALQLRVDAVGGPRLTQEDEATLVAHGISLLHVEDFALLGIQSLADSLRHDGIPVSLHSKVEGSAWQTLRA